MEPTVRSSLVRRSGLTDRRGLATEEKHFAAVCVEAGARYHGVQSAFETPTKTVEALVLFGDSRNSTMALPVSKFSLDAVKERLAESNAKWEAYQ